MTGTSRPEPPSHAIPAEGGKLVAPSAERNVGPLSDLLSEVAPETGAALELASGTGQHIVAFARRLPGLHWQPSEPSPERRASISAYIAESGLTNIAPPIDLNATEPGWGKLHGGYALVFLSNLLHLITTPQAETLIREAARALAPRGVLVIYGPFMRAGQLTSDGDRAFHASLAEMGTGIGYKDDFDVMDIMQATGLEMTLVVEMPANNMALISQKPSF